MQFRHLSSFRIFKHIMILFILIYNKNYLFVITIITYNSRNQNKSSDSTIWKSNMRNATLVWVVEPPLGVVSFGILVSTTLVTLLASLGGIIPLYWTRSMSMGSSLRSKNTTRQTIPFIGCRNLLFSEKEYCPEPNKTTLLLFGMVQVSVRRSRRLSK